MKKVTVLAVLLLFLAGCATHNNVSLTGGKGNVGGTISTSVPF